MDERGIIHQQYIHYKAKTSWGKRESQENCADKVQEVANEARKSRALCAPLQYYPRKVNKLFLACTSLSLAKGYRPHYKMRLRTRDRNLEKYILALPFCKCKHIADRPLAARAAQRTASDYLILYSSQPLILSLFL